MTPIACSCVTLDQLLTVLGLGFWAALTIVGLVGFLRS